MDTVLFIIELIGIISFAAAGAMVAVDNETDLFGVVFISVITCFGGGLLRDLIRHDGLPRCFTMYPQLIACVLTALAVFAIAAIFKRKYIKERELVNRINNILDALGLGIFVSAGVQISINDGALVAIVLGMITAVGGSLTRDVILGGIPFILKKRVYAVATLIGSVAYYLIAAVFMQGSEANHVVATLVSTAVIFTIRMLATVFRLDLPRAINFSEIESDK
ncbi:MAG: TRIC cation channel family protein [Clostridia bacterium]|nr:TRIC cation channel family protein [Clostridia bacterium]